MVEVEEAAVVNFFLPVGLSATQLCKNKVVKSINRMLCTFFINLLIVRCNLSVKNFKLSREIGIFYLSYPSKMPSFL